MKVEEIRKGLYRGTLENRTVDIECKTKSEAEKKLKAFFKKHGTTSI